MTQARRGMKLKRTHPRVGRKRKAASLGSRGPPVSPHVCSSPFVPSACFPPRYREKKGEDGGFLDANLSRRGEGDSKINEKKIRIG